MPIPPEEREVLEAFTPPPDQLPTMEAVLFGVFSSLLGKPPRCNVFVDEATIVAEFAARWPERAERLRDLLNDPNNAQGINDPLWYVLLFAFYFANYFVIVFFNSALVSCVLARFAGMECSLGDGLRAAGSRLPQILGWALVSATVGVILNRQTPSKHDKTGDPLSFGGPVMREVLVALYRAERQPEAAAFHVLKGVYLTMHPQSIDELLEKDRERSRRSYRLFMGFSGWAPGQLESELARDDWFVLPASAELVFRKDTRGMWEELVRKARGRVAMR